ncbi:MAG: WD40 repeat domain-containing protein [Gemmataceae bacterium]|nr:WD40 repeat domain-containing protein [Gemmataceae bacterium]
MQPSLRPLACLAALALALLPLHPAVPQPPPAKAPPPDAAALAHAEGLVKKLYAADYDSARRNPEATRTLAATLLRESQSTKDDPVLRFAGLCQARDLAAQGGDAVVALKAIDELVAHYTVKGLRMKTTALRTASARAATREAGEAVVEAALALVDEALYEEDFDGARSLIESAETAGLKVRSLALYGRVDRRAREIDSARKEHERVKPFVTRLTTDPDDSEANYHVGRYAWLVRGHWEQGANLLARGSDATWKALGEKELARPQEAKQRLELADSYTRLAAEEKGQGKRNLQRRALHWYQLALPRLEGLTRKRVEGELRELAKVFPSALPAAEIVAEIRRLGNPHPGGVQVATVSADGKLILTAGWKDRTAKLWDAQTGKQLHQFTGHTGEIYALAISPDGKYGASGCTHNQLRLWDLQGGGQIRQFAGHTDFVRGAVFLPDGKRLLSASDDKTIRLWMIATGKELLRLTGHTHYVNGLTLTKDGTLAVSCSDDMTVRIWDLVKGKEVRRLDHPDKVAAAAISPDGKLIVSSSNDRVVRVWDAQTGKVLRQLPHPTMAWCLAFLPDGRRLLTGSGTLPPDPKKGGPGNGGATPDAYVRLWDVEEGKELRRLAGHTGLLRTVAVSADGRIAVSCSNDGTVRIWGEKR